MKMRLLNKHTYKVIGDSVIYQYWTDVLSEVIGHITLHIPTIGEGYGVISIDRSVFKRYIFFGPKKYIITMKKMTVSEIADELFKTPRFEGDK
jgi:hypothetical protein